MICEDDSRKSRGVDLSTGYISLGGWPDLHPVMALRNAGCERVIYLTRRGADAVFGQDVAGLLGMSEAQRGAIYALANPESSFSRALIEAAGVWCTDWNSFSPTDLGGLITDAYGAPFEVHDASLVPSGEPYAGTSSDVNLPGCTPGVVPDPVD